MHCEHKGAWEGLKVLEVGPLFFALPEDFSGTASDALRLLADYHESPEASANRVVGDEAGKLTPAFREERKVRWSELLDAVKEGNRVCGVLSRTRILDGVNVKEGLD